MLRIWSKDRPFGSELTMVTLGDGALSAQGVALGTTPEPYRLDYELTTAKGYVTTELRVRAVGEAWHRALDVRRAASGQWSCTVEVDGSFAGPAPGGDLGILDGALDCDLARSPLTNSMPVLRHSLHESGGPIDFLMAWVSVPDLVVHPSRQRYSFVRREGRERIVRYESLDGDFVAEIRFDERGLVLDYPGIARRVG